MTRLTVCCSLSEVAYPRVPRRVLFGTDEEEALTDEKTGARRERAIRETMVVVHGGGDYCPNFLTPGHSLLHGVSFLGGRI